MLIQLNQFDIHDLVIFHRNDPADVMTVVCIKQERIMQQLPAATTVAPVAVVVVLFFSQTHVKTDLFVNF
jgi:hypothetical protein